MHTHVILAPGAWNLGLEALWMAHFQLLRRIQRLEAAVLRLRLGRGVQALARRRRPAERREGSSIIAARRARPPK